jgi:cytochrome P450
MSTNLIGSMLLLLLNNPDQLAALLEYRSLEQNAVEEALRLDSPVQGLFRTATQEVEIGGVRIPKGAHRISGLGDVYWSVSSLGCAPV